ncbi:MAG: lysophospholipid acyltransferase family protein [Armatimonadetes bacterium]|nr:lysophospholipid acyltransferase family protein [Armatimonadota bacterium]MBS1726245.1 lysophospholipid acyltransferase family protein [Armatimonadota bacterium]
MSDTLKVRIRKRVAIFLGYTAVRFIGKSLRLQVDGWEKFEGNDQKAIFCGWHGKSLIFANYFRKRGYWVIISTSNDGDIQNEIFLKLGYQTIRGSTAREGVRAALQGVKKIKEGGTMAITPDGPRGPSGVVQGGVMLMAHKAGARLVPVGISAKSAFYANSWDRYMLPKPFSKARMIFGDPLTVPENASEEQVEEVRLQLENEIKRLEALASDW